MLSGIPLVMNVINQTYDHTGILQQSDRYEI